MRLLELKLENFKGIKSLNFRPNGNSASVYGTNGTGKTTIADAFTWLMYDKASDASSGFTPKTEDGEGGYLHNLENSVEGVFLDEVNGEEITFKKSLREVYAQKRGEATKTASGHTTDYFIDGVPVQKKEYDSRIAEICEPDKAIILTQAQFFGKQLPWQKRREILLAMCGEVSESDVLNSSPELRELTEYLLKGNSGQMYSVEEYTKIAKAQLKEVKDKMDKLPARIDEAYRAIPEDVPSDPKETMAKCSDLNLKIERLKADKMSLALSGSDASLHKEIADLKSKLLDGEIQHRQRYQDSIKDQQDQLNRLSKQLTEVSRKKFDLTEELHQTASKIDKVTALREKLAQEYQEANSSTYQGDDCCPTCGQALPEDKVADAQAKFNAAKADKLSKIRSEIEKTCSKVMIAELKVKADECNQAFVALDENIRTLKQMVTTTEKAVPEMQDWKLTGEYTSLVTLIAAKQKIIDSGKASTSEQENAIQANIDDLEALLAEENTKLLQISMAQAQQKRIADLEAEQRTNAEQYENISKGLYLCEQYTRARVALLTDKINSQFQYTRFKLFRDQVNGGVEEICEVMPKTAKGYIQDANRAAEVRSGLEIIDKLGEFWNAKLPVFIDNAESFVELPDTDTQVIRLVVSAKDKVLRVDADSDVKAIA